MDDMDKTMAPQRQHEHNYDADEVTMPGRRDRKPDGRFQIGDLIKNRYKVLAELGQGGMGVVYKCFDEDAGIEVALKALPPELSHNTLEMEDIKENFQLVHNLHHPNIAAYNNLEKDHTNGNYYLIMECCEGEDLRRWIKRKHREQDLTVADVLPILKQIAKALDYAHSMKIIHRDIKPGNIMIDAAGNIKVLDFGLAAQIHTSMTRVSMAYHGTSGTGPYMAPEQWRGKRQNASADQYALAVLTYEMLSGNLPFESPDPAVLKQAVLDETPDPIDDLPEDIQKAIFRAMSKKPEERFASCSDFVATMQGENVKTVRADHPKKIITASATAPATDEYYAMLWNVENWEKKFQTEKLSFSAEMERYKRLAEMAKSNGDTAFAFEQLKNFVAAAEKFFADIQEQRKAEEQRKAAEEELMRFLKFDFDGVIFEMVRIKAGTFMMGSPKNETGGFDVEKQHQVTLTRDYLLGKYPVTQAQWRAVMGTNPSYFKGDDRPVENVNWEDAKEFCQKLNQRYARNLPDGYQFDLPTEAQWEYACRAGTKTALNNGKNLTTDIGLCSNLDEVAWYYANSVQKQNKSFLSRLFDVDADTHETKPVGQKRPNAWGLYDMHGNVGEWCRDWYGPYSDVAVTDPTGPKTGSYRVYRGGSWSSSAEYCRSASQIGHSPGARRDYLGFRLALVPEQ